MGYRAQRPRSNSSAAIVAIASLNTATLEEGRVRVLEYAAGLRLRLWLSSGLCLSLVTLSDFFGYELAEDTDLLALWSPWCAIEISELTW